MPNLAHDMMGWVKVYVETRLRAAGISGSVVDAGHLTGAIPPDVGGGGGGAGTITVEEADGTPSVADVDTIKVSPGTLTDNADGSVTIDTGLVPSSYVVIEDQTLAADAAAWTSVPIDGAYEHLVVIWSGKCSASTGPVVGLRVNGDTAANYDTQVQEVSNITTSAFQAIGGTSIRVGLIPASSLADVWNGGRIEVIAIQSARQKAVMSRHARKDGTASGNIRIEQATGFWRGTAAITSVTLLALSDGFEQGSRFTLYGQLAAPLGGGGAVTSHDALTDVSADDHHAQVHTLTGANHSVSGLTAGHALRATGAASFAFGAVQHADLGGVSADQHHAQAHSGTGADHTYSGLTAGHVLTATSATAAAFAAVTAPAMVRIAETVLGATTASVTFSSIPGTYRHLRLVCLARCNAAATVVTLSARFNADTGANYDSQFATALGSSVVAGEGFAQTTMPIGAVTGASATTSEFAPTDVLVPFYAFGGVNKTVLGVYGRKEAVTTGKIAVSTVLASWRSVAAVTEITLFPSSGSFVAGSIFSLFAMT